MIQLITLNDLLDNVSSEMLRAMSVPWRDGTVFDFWLETNDKVQKIIKIFEIDTEM